MTQEYEFFKDFAGVTKADLEMFKCGGKSKVKKGQDGEVIRSTNPRYRRKQKEAADEASNVKARQDNTKVVNKPINKQVVKKAENYMRDQAEARKQMEFRKQAEASINAMKREGTWQNPNIKTNEDFPPERPLKRKNNAKRP